MTAEAQAITDEQPAIASRDAEFTASEGYRRYVLGLLFLVYVFNFIDRQILTILVTPIKTEFGLSDTQLGLLGGLAFALLYSTLGIPIARRADRTSRVNIIAISLFAWSLFTAATGLARTFTQLILARVAVGIGEAGCSPPAYSLISDYFPPQRRSTALSIYSMGIYGGVFLGLLVGGQVAETYGWRAAFYILGLPGVVLAVVVKLTLREPPRGFSETSPVIVQEPLPIGEVIRTLWSKPAFRHVSFAAALHSFVGYGVGGFHPAFLARTHGMSVAEIGRWLALISLVGGLIGTLLGGSLADRMSIRRGDMRYQLWIPGISTLINVPFSLLVYTLPVKYWVLGMLIPTIAIGTMYLGPTFAITQSLSGIRERALSGALMLLIINLIGLGLGPVLTGMLSDALKAHYEAQGVGTVLATAQGLRSALCVMVCVNLWSAFHYLRATRTLREDLAVAAAARA